MSEHILCSSKSISVAQLKEMFGSPPLLTSESVEAYDKTLAGLVDSFNPQDAFEAMLVRQVADETAFATRYMRHKSLAVDRRLRSRLAFQAKQARALAERKGNRAELNDERGKMLNSEKDRLFELLDVIENTSPDLEEIRNHAATERHHAWALEAAIKYIEQLDKLITSAMARRNVALRQLEAYREGLGRHLRRVSDEIIGEFKEVGPTDRQSQVAPLASVEITDEVITATEPQIDSSRAPPPEVTKKEVTPTEQLNEVLFPPVPETTNKQGEPTLQHSEVPPDPQHQNIAAPTLVPESTDEVRTDPGCPPGQS
jgi:hypothetical protein